MRPLFNDPPGFGHHCLEIGTIVIKRVAALRRHHSQDWNFVQFQQKNDRWRNPQVTLEEDIT